MKKRILIVEDDGLVYKMLINALDTSLYEIVRVRAVDEAIGAVEEDGPFDCFVVDLSILATGLKLEEMAEYQRREGYAFLENYLWKGSEEEIKELKRRTVICSRYVNDFRKEHREGNDGLKTVLKDKGFEKRTAFLIGKICYE